MYKVLGNDGNEYGPVSAEQVKQWIAENRVEKKTPVFPEGAKDWVFLESLPEFAATFAPPPPALPQPGIAPPPPAPPPKSVAPVPAPAETPKSAEYTKVDVSAGPGEQDRREETHDPRENSCAWMACCLGVVSVVPPFGVLVGIPALILGILGLRFLRRHPEVNGRFHAWMGIILGGVFGVGYLILFLLVLLMGLSRPA